MTGPRPDADLPHLPEPTWRSADAYRFDAFDLEEVTVEQEPAPPESLSVWLILALYVASMLGGAIALGQMFPGEY